MAISIIASIQPSLHPLDEHILLQVAPSPPFYTHLAILLAEHAVCRRAPLARALGRAASRGAGLDTSTRSYATTRSGGTASTSRAQPRRTTKAPTGTTRSWASRSRRLQRFYTGHGCRKADFRFTAQSRGHSRLSPHQNDAISSLKCRRNCKGTCLLPSARTRTEG
jgi:hypothetical protein